MKKIIGIACLASNRAIGNGNKLIYNLKSDMKHFRKTTSGKTNNKQNAIVMGRKTFESIGKALPGRLNCVLSKKNPENSIKNIKYFTNIPECIVDLKSDDSIDKIYIIGRHR